MERCQLATFVALFMLASWPCQANASAYTHYRLPTSIHPDHYQLKIITHLENPANLTFDGEVSIQFQVLENTNNITLHVKNLTIDDSLIELKRHDDENSLLCLEGVKTVPEFDYYIIRLCQTLLKGQVYKVKLYFSSTLNMEATGYMRNSYVDEATSATRWLSVTQFEPDFARSAFPCFDEPNYKANFTIWLGHNKSLTALSNMPLEKQIPLNDSKDFVWSIFEESVPMSTYLVAYTVNDFAYIESQVEGSDVVFRTWSRRDRIDQCNYAAKVAPKILKYYEDMLGIPFPFKKVDQLAVHKIYGRAMENWGLIIYQEDTLLADSNASSLFDKSYTAKVIAHELAHQWFGNLVTMKWWTDLWLNEGFATYMESLGLQSLTAELGLYLYNEDALYNVISIFSSDAKLNSHPISAPIFNSSQIRGNFDVIPYKKGSDVLRMAHLLLGQDEFFEGVHDYLTKHKYQNAEQDDLWSVFTEKAHKYDRIRPQHDIKTILDSWTLQSGYPLVNISRNYKTGSIEISQHRFLENSTISDEEVKRCWWVPLSYTSASELDFMTTTPKAWLECDESGNSIALNLDNVTSANEWVIFNIQLSGVYRVMYDADNWRLLMETLNSDKFMDIHVMNRAQIIDDVLSFAWSGYLDYSFTFDVLDYLAKESEYLPWMSATYSLNDISNLVKAFPEAGKLFKAYMRHVITPLYSYVIALNGTDETQLSLKEIAVDWACVSDQEDFVRTALNYFQQWKSLKNPDEENKIPAEIQYSVYCAAIRHGNVDDWTFLWQRFQKSKLATNKIAISASLSCSRNETLLRHYIDLIFDTDGYMALYAFDAFASGDIGNTFALQYFTEHAADLNDSGVDMADLFVALSMHTVSAKDRNKSIYQKCIDWTLGYFLNNKIVLK